jgi:Spy/CpxP family protein refolding chaperone
MKFSRAAVVLSSLLLGVSLATATAWAQSDSGSHRGGGGDASGEGFGLLRVERVQQNLHLTDEQKVQILALSMELRENRANLGKRIAEILTAEQMKRLKQIRLQVEGVAAINSHEVAMTLGLTKDQRKTLKALQEQIGKQVQEAVTELKGLTVDERKQKMPEFYAKVEAIRKNTTEQALAVLTSSQRKEFEEMQGEKIDFGPSPFAAKPAASPEPSEPAK